MLNWVLKNQMLKNRPNCGTEANGAGTGTANRGFGEEVLADIV